MTVTFMFVNLDLYWAVRSPLVWPRHEHARFCSDHYVTKWTGIISPNIQIYNGLSYCRRPGITRNQWWLLRFKWPSYGNAPHCLHSLKNGTFYQMILPRLDVTNICLELSYIYEIWQAPGSDAAGAPVKFKSDTTIMMSIFKLARSVVKQLIF